MEEFTKYGQKPGPIVDSTRGLYRRKLAQLRRKLADETKREKGEEEEEGEAGVIEEPASSVRLRSNTTKIQHSKEPPSRPCPPQSSAILSLVLGVALLLVMFAIYNTLHTTKPCPCPPPTIIPQSNKISAPVFINLELGPERGSPTGRVCHHAPHLALHMDIAT